MKTVNLHEAKTQLSKLVAAAVAGEDIVIAKAGTPLVRLIPVAGVGQARALGGLAGQVTESPGWWEPDHELEDLFYGSEDEPARRVAEP